MMDEPYTCPMGMSTGNLQFFLVCVKLTKINALNDKISSKFKIVKVICCMAKKPKSGKVHSGEGFSILDVDASLKAFEAEEQVNARQATVETDPASKAYVPKVVRPKYIFGRPTKYQPEWMLEKVLELGMNGASRAKIAFVLGIHYDTLVEWEKRYPDFSDALKMAKLGAQVWFEEIMQAAVLGQVEKVPAALLIFALKSRFAQDYRDVRHTEISGKDGDPLEVQAVAIDVKSLDPEQRELVKQALLAAKSAAERGPVTIDNESDDEE